MFYNLINGCIWRKNTSKRFPKKYTRFIVEVFCWDQQEKESCDWLPRSSKTWTNPKYNKNVGRKKARLAIGNLGSKKAVSKKCVKLSAKKFVTGMSAELTIRQYCRL